MSTFDLESAIDQAQANELKRQQNSEASYAQKCADDRSAIIADLTGQLACVIPDEAQEALHMRVDLRSDDPTGLTNGRYCVYFDYKGETLVYAYDRQRNRWTYFYNSTAAHSEHRLTEVYPHLLLELAKLKSKAGT